jgi:predicted ATP-grasp superfamily ATP-dependent carboligase
MSKRQRMSTATRNTLVTVPKTLGVLALLLVALPFTLALTVVALLRSVVVRPHRSIATAPKTILVSGGKMTKALQLARSFHAAGHRVILIESEKYWLTGHRFSRSVDRFYTVPKPQSPGYVDALVAIVQAESVDVYVPVCSPIASYYDALAKPVLSQFCEVLHEDPDMIKKLDDKYEFSVMAQKAGLSVPDSHRISSPEQVVGFDFAASAHQYILKSIPYDPLHRLDLTTLPRPLAQDTAAFARSKPINDDAPWIMQEMVRGQEYCTHSTVRDGQVQVYCCCESSAFQINNEMVDKPEIEAWVRKFVEPLKLTGQVSFDFIQADDGQLYAIECNPRTHSAITMFYDHPSLAQAYLDDDHPMITPLTTSRPTYWTYHEMWRLLSQPTKVASRLRIIRRGKDAIFDWNDPLPFLLVYHAQIPWLLLKNLRHLKYWIRIDFNIGKLVEPAGD